MAITPHERPTLWLFLPDGKIPPGKRLYLFLADDSHTIGRPIQKPRPGWVGDLVPIAEVIPTPAGPLRAYSREEFCRLTGMSLRTFGREWKSGRLVARKIGGRTVVTFEDAMAYLRGLARANAEDVLLISEEMPLDEAC
ncbi:hypothetical protein GETHPA_28550 [Geothrix rubra]|uniref:Helix-turn-helix domain-containing protein n=1 Tax=Geothrix rubra TaxID=2927977 RepID=A0ABQ5Q9D1_9BACT|nr:hypothetical protein [Geothrix rubra]GLH71322.1 hypothetical protein GETHPA_28550 [Geothrix rubra]